MEKQLPEIPRKFVRWDQSTDSSEPMEEMLIPQVRHRWIKLKGVPQWTELVESGRAGPSSESSQNSIDREMDGHLYPNWKTLGRILKVSPPKFMRYFIWKILFAPEELILNVYLKNALVSLLPDHVTVKGGPSYQNVMKKNKNKKTGKVESYSLWELKPDHEELLYSRLLYFILPSIERNDGNPFILTKSERRIILGFLRQYGIDHFGIKRAYLSQRKTLMYERILTKVSSPMTPKRKKARPPRRRRSSEDRSGKPGLSKLGNLPTEKPPSDLPTVTYLRDGLPLLKYHGNPLDELTNQPSFQVDPTDLKPLGDYIQVLLDQGLLRRRNLLQSPLVRGRVPLIKEKGIPWESRLKDNKYNNRETLGQIAKTLSTMWIPPWEREED